MVRHVPQQIRQKDEERDRSGSPDPRACERLPLAGEQQPHDGEAEHRYPVLVLQPDPCQHPNHSHSF